MLPVPSLILIHGKSNPNPATSRVFFSSISGRVLPALRIGRFDMPISSVTLCGSAVTACLDMPTRDCPPACCRSARLRALSSRVALALGVIMLAFLGGCSTAYYSTMEKLGVPKREIMVDRVGKARDAQEDAKQQFQSALEQFTQVVQLKGGDLERKYKLLDGQYKQCKEEADTVHKRIRAVESVSEALFAEWEAELQQYTNAALRRDSKDKLEATRRQYEQLINAMRRAEGKIQPVLSVFNDQVLYLKHNLNAQAIAALQGELVNLEANVDRLVREMETSIREADEFISKLQKT